MNNNLYGKYRQRIAKEGFLKSLFLGIIFASVAMIITAFISWFFDFKPGLFIAIAVFVVVTAGVTALFYFLRYRPTVKQVAGRVDELGLEERVLTMTELEGDESEIARLQRADTVKALGSVNHMMIKIAISAAIIVPLAICGVLGAGMLTVSSLHYADIIPSGLVTLTPEYIPGVYTVAYSTLAYNIDTENGGTVAVENAGGTVIYYTGDWANRTAVSEDGDKVKEGEDAKAVYASPLKNYAFVSWSDGKTDPYRHDLAVDDDIYVQAIFEQIEPDPENEQAEENAEQEGQEGQEGEGNQQGEGQDGSQNGDGQQSGQEGEPSEGDGDESQDGDSSGQNQSSGSPQGQPGNSAAGSRDLSSQQIVDGQTYYGDQFDDAYQQAQDRLNSDNNIPDDLKGYVNDYYHSIETGGSDDGNGGN